ncbi:MAG: polysaccharide deacetylase family protein [Beijerinckiaceae bacterium]|nr:polysaccharide deacetylase family protein [Beijerinckiaceae bacterium]
MQRLSVLFAVLIACGNGAASHSEGNAPRACPAGTLGTSRVLEIGAQGGLEVGFKTYPRSLPLGDHEVVLTFDDGPDAATTPAVLDALAAQCVKATFFLIGRNAQANPRIARRELAEGHTIGHHSFSHPAITLRRLSTAAAEADIDKGMKADDLAAYGRAGPEPRVPFFRYPGFADTPEVNRWLAARNIAIFGADLWASDWQDMTPQVELALIMARLERTKGGIVLLHDSRGQTAAMLPAFLAALKAQGFKIVHIVPGPGNADTRPAPTGWTSETERIITEVFQREDGKARRPGPTNRDLRGGT